MEWIYWISTGLLTILATLYWYLTKDFDYWKNKNVFYIQPTVFFGNYKDRIILKKSFHEFQKDLYFMFKGHKFAGLFEGRLPNLMVLDPDMIKLVLVKDFDHFVDRDSMKFKTDNFMDKMLITLRGSQWKSVRAAITPTFTSGKIKNMLEMTNQCGQQLEQYLDKVISAEGKTSEVIDVKDIIGKFTLDVIATCAFGVQTDSLKEPDSDFAANIAKFNDIPIIMRYILVTVIVLRLPESITKHLPLYFMNPDVTQYLERIVKDTSKHRLQHGIRRNDFLQLMIETEKEFVQTSESVLNEEIRIAQCILFFIAGYETSGTQLAMACYELAKNPEVQEKTRHEILEKVKNPLSLDYEVLNELNYLDMVLSETLRMYPPVSKLDRVATKDYQFPDGPFIEKGTRINISVIGLHYDPDLYPEPEKFDPLRFTQEEKLSRSPYVYLPFGAGPRNCIGLRFSQMTTKVCMIHLLKNYTIDLCEKTAIPFEYHKRSMLLKAKDGVWLRIKRVES